MFPTLPHGLATTVARRVLVHRRALAALCTAAAVLLALQTLRPAPPDLVQVRVAARDLPAGHSIRAADLHRASFDPDLVPEGLAPDPVGAVLASGLRRGEVITDARVLGPGLAGDGLVALPVRIPDAGAVAVVRVGDAVDLIAVPAVSGPTGEADAPGSEDVRVLARSARVLALPTTPESSTPTGPGGGRLVVLAVAPEATVPIAAAAARDWLTLALSP